MSARAVCGCGWERRYSSPARAAAMAGRHVCRTRSAVRRATRSYRCGRCGLEAVYENAGAAESRYWFNRHSCRKREEAMLRAAFAEEKRAAVDRTPRACLHKFAGHEHGTAACYVLDLCRCDPCTEANRQRQSERVRLKAYGRYHKYVNAEHVRAHLQELKDYGIGLKTVSRLSGVSNGSLTKIWYGLYADTGRGGGRHHGEGQLVRGPSRRVLRSTAEAIYAVEAVPANLGARVPDRDRTPIARLHLRALVALGWSMSELGRRIGMRHAGNVCRVVTEDTPMARETVDKIEALYTALSMTLPPEATQGERITASRARRYARDHGWVPPLAIDDDDPLGLDEAVGA